MNKNLMGVMPVGAPWGGPESIRFVSCFASLNMAVEKYDPGIPCFCDHDIGLCKNCGKCGDFFWENKKHEQVYQTFLTLSGLGCYTVWKDDFSNGCLPEIVSVVNDDEYIRRSMAAAGYLYADLSGRPKDEMKDWIVRSLEKDIPVLAYRLAGDDWSIITGYAENGEILLGRYVPGDSDEAGKAPDAFMDGEFTQSNGYRRDTRILIVDGKCNPSNDYPELFSYLTTILEGPNTKDCISGLAAYDACVAQLNNADFINSASEDQLIALYRLTHQFIGTLAESRCFASFAFLQALFGRVSQENAVGILRTIGGHFMDTHNQCWGAWAVIGQDYRCQPELYVKNFSKPETREKAIAYINLFKENDQKVISLLKEAALWV